MWWKIYFWILVVAAALSLVGIFSLKGTMWQIPDFLDMGSTILIVVGMYVYAFNKRLAQPIAWQIAFWFIIFGYVVEALYRFTSIRIFSSILQSQNVVSDIEIAASLIFVLPALYALYRLAYKRV